MNIGRDITNIYTQCKLNLFHPLVFNRRQGNAVLSRLSYIYARVKLNLCAPILPYQVIQRLEYSKFAIYIPSR